MQALKGSKSRLGRRKAKTGFFHQLGDIKTYAFTHSDLVARNLTLPSSTLTENCTLLQPNDSRTRWV